MLKVKKLLVGLGAIGITLSLAACKDNSVTSLSLKGYPNTFTVGDTFNSDGLLVEANTSDGTINVSDDVTLDSSAVDMSKAGTYVVIVKYNNVEQPYYITVNEAPNEQRLLSLVLDTTRVKKNYLIGEAFDSSGLGVIATYQNSNDDPNDIVYTTDLSNFDIIIRDSLNNSVTETFTKPGEYTIYITKDTVRTSYNVVVASSFDNSINGVIALAISNKNLVATGSSVNSYANSLSNYGNSMVFYEFGDNLLNVEYSKDGNNYYTCYYADGSNYKGYVVNETTNENKILTNVEADDMSGLEYYLFNNELNYNNAEDLLKALYDLAISNPNYDTSETVLESSTDDGDKAYEYSFSFSYLTGDVNAYYLHKTEVTFTLGQTNYLNHLVVNVNTYVCDSSKTEFEIFPKGNINSDEFYSPDRVLPGSNYPSDYPVLTPNYTLADCMARVKSSITSSSESYRYEIIQSSGSRTAQNRYPNIG